MISEIMKLRGKIVIQITNNYYLIVHESERLFWIEFFSLTVWWNYIKFIITKFITVVLLNISRNLILS